MARGAGTNYAEKIMFFAFLAAMHFCAAAGLVYGFDRLALIPWRKASGAHWTERARLIWPARKTNGMLFIVVPVLLAMAQTSLAPELPSTYLYAALAGLAGALLGMRPMARAIFPELSFEDWFRSISVSIVIRLTGLAVVIAAGILMPYQIDMRAVLLTAGVIAFILWLIWGGLLWLLRAFGVLVVAPERLANVVGSVAAEMEAPMPQLWMLRGFGSNAMAFPVIHALVVTEGALKALPDDELAAVCAHEFAHLNEPRRVVLARILGSFVLLPGIFVKPAIEAWQALGYFGICMAILIFSRFAGAFRRKMETLADSVARTHEGASPGTYARALERLYEINLTPAVLGRGQTHPNLYDRLLAAGVTPDYPRPAPPPRFTWQYGVLILLLSASGFCIAFRAAQNQGGRHAGPPMEEKNER